MEYIDGQDLARVVADEFPLAPTRIIHIMKQVCSALDEAHAAGIIHRDLKLANIMISQRRTGEEFVKVLDFGIAKMADPMQSDGAAMTREGLIAGTPAFMSPEQIRGHELDPRTDIYSLGVVLFMLLTGRLPFQGQTAADIAARVLTEKAPKPSRVRLDLDVPPVFDGIVARAMALDRDERYASAEELRRALESAQAQLNRPAGAQTPPHGLGPSTRPPRSMEHLPTVRGAPGNVRPGGRPPRRPGIPAHATARMNDDGGFSAGASTQVSVPSYDMLKADALAAAGANKRGGNPSGDPTMATVIQSPAAVAPKTSPDAPAVTQADMRSVSRLGSLLGLVAFVAVALLASAGAYALLINAPENPNAPNARDAHLLKVNKAVGKAAYHVKLGFVRADDAARSPDAETMLANTDNPTSEDDDRDTSDDHKTIDFDPQLLPANNAPHNAQNKPRDWASKPPRDKVKKETPPPTPPPETPPKDAPKSAYQMGIDAMRTNPRAALGHFKTAAQQNPRNRSAWIQVSRMAMRVGQGGEAKRACLRVIALSRNRDAPRLTCEKMLKR
ncbi:MAG: serine/threonine-protein kinase, partial [Myxococcota bacterium]